MQSDAHHDRNCVVLATTRNSSITRANYKTNVRRMHAARVLIINLTLERLRAQLRQDKCNPADHGAGPEANVNGTKKTNYDMGLGGRDTNECTRLYDRVASGGTQRSNLQKFSDKFTDAAALRDGGAD